MKIRIHNFSLARVVGPVRLPNFTCSFVWSVIADLKLRTTILAQPHTRHIKLQNTGCFEQSKQITDSISTSWQFLNEKALSFSVHGIHSTILLSATQVYTLSSLQYVNVFFSNPSVSALNNTTSIFFVSDLQTVVNSGNGYIIHRE